MITNREESNLRTVEQICSKTDELLQRAHELDELSSTIPEVMMELNRVLGQVEALQWTRYVSGDL
jgi:hypothetical protein